MAPTWLLSLRMAGHEIAQCLGHMLPLGFADAVMVAYQDAMVVDHWATSKSPTLRW